MGDQPKVIPRIVVDGLEYVRADLFDRMRKQRDGFRDELAAAERERDEAYTALFDSSVHPEEWREVLRRVREAAGGGDDGE